MPDYTDYGTGYDLDTVGGPSWTLSGSVVPDRYIIAYREPTLNQGRAGDVVAYASASVKAHQEFEQERAYLNFDVNDFIAKLGSFDANVGSGVLLGTAAAAGTGIGTSTNLGGTTGTAGATGTAEIANEDEGHSTILGQAFSTADPQSIMAPVASVTASAASGLVTPVAPPIPPPVIPTGPPAASAMLLLEFIGYLARAEIFKLEADFDFTITSSYKLIDMDEIKDAVLTQGPVLLGLELDSGFRTPDTTTHVLPEPTGSVTERHAFVVYGWDDDKETEVGTGALLVKNSWGLEYGNRGFVWMPYTYISTYAFDAWVTDDTADVII